MSNHNSFSGVLRRSIQLDAIAYLLIAALLVLTAILAFMLFNSVVPPSGWVFNDTAVQLIGLAFVGGLVIYLLDQHGRLRRNLESSHDALEIAQHETELACQSLTSAHNVATVVTSIVGPDALERSVDTIRHDFNADAVAIIGAETIASYGRDVDECVALDAVTRVAAETVRTGSPIAIAGEQDGSTTLAVPLRVNGRLQGVLCVWQASDRLSTEELEGLTLIARVLELGWESQIAYQRVSEQLNGIVAIVDELVDQRIPGYAEETARMLDLAVAVATDLEMSDDEIADLEVAIRLRDLGVLSEHGDDAFAHPLAAAVPAKHPIDGARLADLGRFPQRVSQTILCHHECPDGSGYPVKLTGDRIPRTASVIHACETFIELAETDGPFLRAGQALSVIEQGADTSFDKDVVEALAAVVRDRESELSMMGSPVI